MLDHWPDIESDLQVGFVKRVWIKCDPTHGFTFLETQTRIELARQRPHPIVLRMGRNTQSCVTK